MEHSRKGRVLRDEAPRRGRSRSQCLMDRAKDFGFLSKQWALPYLCDGLGQCTLTELPSIQPSTKVSFEVLSGEVLSGPNEMTCLCELHHPENQSLA